MKDKKEKLINTEKLINRGSKMVKKENVDRILRISALFLLLIGIFCIIPNASATEWWQTTSTPVYTDNFATVGNWSGNISYFIFNATAGYMSTTTQQDHLVINQTIPNLNNSGVYKMDIAIKRSVDGGASSEAGIQFIADRLGLALDTNNLNLLNDTGLGGGIELTKSWATFGLDHLATNYYSILVNYTAGNISVWVNPTGFSSNDLTQPSQMSIKFNMTLAMNNSQSIYLGNDGMRNYANTKQMYKTMSIYLPALPAVNPTISITYPANASNYTYKPSQLNFTVTNANDCWYSLDNGITNSSTPCVGNVTGLNPSQGWNNWSVWVNSTSNTIVGTRARFFVDSIQPNVNLTFPLPQNYSYNVTLLNYTVSDTNLQSCWYSTNQTTNVTITCGNNVTGLTSVEGWNTWYVYTNDTYGNTNSSNVTFFKDSINPNINITYPYNAMTFVNNIITLLNYTLFDANPQSCWYSLNGGITNVTITCGNNVTGLSSNYGQNNWTVWANDTLGNINSSRVIFFFDNASISNNLAWVTTGGITSSSLIYNQVMANITINVSDVNNDIVNVNITVTDPDGNLIVNNQQMSNTTYQIYNYSNQFILNNAGTWIINITAYDRFTQNSSVSTLDVSTLLVSTKDGFYGYTKDKILSSSEMSSAFIYGYDLFELTANSSSINNSFGTLFDAVNNSNNLQIKVGINYLLDSNFTNATIRNDIKLNISSLFPSLNTDPYYITIAYISLEVNNSGLYNDSQIYSSLNDLASNITSATANKFAVYSKNYNSSSLNGQYIKYTPMLYVNTTDQPTWINTEANLTETHASLNRIYINPSSTLQNLIKTYQTTILNVLRSPINASGMNNLTAHTTNGDLIVYNNLSTPVLRTINFTGNTTAGNDFWDTTNKLFVANKSTSLMLTVNVSAYSATYVLSDNLDRIMMTSNNAGTLYKSTSGSQLSFNYTNGTQTSNIGLYGAWKTRIELFDPNYILSGNTNSFIVYYGWLNASYINFSANPYNVLILADKNPSEIAQLNCTKDNSSACYGYISVSDYANTQAWTLGKENEADNWTAINSSMNLFVDGLDIGAGGINFSNRFKDLINHIRVTKAKKAILNTYTYYQQFATLGDGVMAESCGMRWNGLLSNNPDNYTFEDWNLQVNKSIWFGAHGIPVYCQAFQNRSTNPYQLDNYTITQDVFFASKVLGYNYFYSTQPDFNYAWTEYLPNVGTDMSNKMLTDDNQTYYRRYSNGIVYYNTSSNHGSFDNGRVINNVSICFNLYDAFAGASTWGFDVNRRIYSGGICGGGADLAPFGDYMYSIPDTQLTLFGWKTVCVQVNASENGRYSIESAVFLRTTISGQGLNIGIETIRSKPHASWYDYNAGCYQWTNYGLGQNYEVNVNVNDSIKTSLDTTNGITQTLSSKNGRNNLTMSSIVPYNIQIYSTPQITPTTTFHNISYFDGTNYIALNLSNSSDCATNNPTMNTTIITGSTFGACYTQNISSTTWRVLIPSLSSKTFIMDGDTVIPNATLLAPANGTITTNGTQNYTANLTDNEGIKNYSLYIYNQTGLVNISSGINLITGTVTQVVSFVVGLIDGVYNWFYTVFDFGENSFTTNNNTITIDSTPPNITFISQIPSDINTQNLYNFGLNISYNITDLIGTNLSSVEIYYKTNSTINNATRYINGTAFIGLFNQSISNVSINWTFRLDDNDIYPSIFPLAPEIFENTTPSFLSLAGNDIAKLELFNVSNKTAFNNFEFMANSSAGASSLFEFYCNSSYVSGTITTNTNCFQFGSLAATQTFNVTNPMLGNSSYQLIAMPINVTSGQVGTVKITANSYLALRHAAGGNWFVYDVPQIAGTGYSQSSVNNGGAYTNRTFTFNMHLHQYLGNDTFFYYACANDTLGNYGCSVERQDLLEIAGLPPTAPHIFEPINGFYSGNITINYTQSFSPNSYDIVFYNISLANLDESYNSSIRNNNSLNLSYVWNSVGTPDGTYLIKVIVTDNQSQTSFDFSENFTIDNTPPNGTILSPINGEYTNITSQNFSINVSDNSSGVQNITLHIYNQTGLFNQTTFIIGGAVQSTVSIVIGLVDSVYNWFWSIWDTANNNFITANSTMTVDTISPYINITYPLNATYSYNVTELNYTITDINPQTCMVYNGTANNTITCGTNMTSNLSSLQGLNTWGVYANDSAGNMNSSFVTFFVDSIVPNITLNHPINNENVSKKTISFNCTASDVNLINRTLYIWNSSNSLIFNNTNTTNSNVTATLLIDDFYNWTCSARDTANNLEIANNYTFILDSTGPAINVTYPLSTTYNTSILIINYTVSDINLQSCWFYNGTANNTITCGDNSTTNLNSTLGTNKWIVYANDSFGNVNQSSVTFTYLPAGGILQLNVTSPLNGSTLAFPGYILMNLTVGINSSNPISSYWYNINNGLNVTFNISTFVHFEQPDGSTRNYNLYVYANDTSNNINSTILYLTIVQTAIPGGGGNINGGGSSTYINNTNRTYINDTGTYINNALQNISNSTNQTIVNESQLNVIERISTDVSKLNPMEMLLIALSIVGITTYFLTQNRMPKRRDNPYES